MTELHYTKTKELMAVGVLVHRVSFKINILAVLQALY